MAPHCVDNGSLYFIVNNCRITPYWTKSSGFVLEAVQFAEEQADPGQLGPVQHRLQVGHQGAAVGQAGQRVERGPLLERVVELGVGHRHAEVVGEGQDGRAKAGALNEEDC